MQIIKMLNLRCFQFMKQASFGSFNKNLIILKYFLAISL